MKFRSRSSFNFTFENGTNILLISPRDYINIDYLLNECIMHIDRVE